MTEEARNLLRRAGNAELPFQALPAIAALRECLDRFEQEAIQSARQKGAAWDDIAEVMGITRQALHYRLKTR